MPLALLLSMMEAVVLTRGGTMGTMQPQQRRWAFWFGAGLVALMAILSTPFLLERAAPAGKDWDELSAVSQTYGAASVFFSAAALLGVVASIAYQARQTSITNQEAQRASHRQLLLVALEHPELQACWEPMSGVRSEDQARKVLYTNLIVSNWSADYRLRRANEPAARVQLEVHFQGEAARDHWAVCAATWRRYATAEGDHRGLHFVDLMDEMYEQALAAGPAVPSASYFTPPPRGSAAAAQ
ncbi:DUF6082 family protein [Streptomyces sp. NPDC057460]|uniref:DUF6082 family protein n=2 Tax=unclassified Streptomyces TaxID=2593676 RepID=UPI00368AB4C1